MIFNDFMMFDVPCPRKHIFVVDNEVPSLVPTHILIFLLISSSFLFSLQHVSSLSLCFILLTFSPSIFSLSLCLFFFLSSSSSLPLFFFFPSFSLYRVLFSSSLISISPLLLILRPKSKPNQTNPFNSGYGLVYGS